MCYYSGGTCGFPDDDVSCECCSGYRAINCEKCKQSSYAKYGGMYCEKDGHSITVRCRVCVDLEPNCFFCENAAKEYYAGDAHYKCKLGKKDSDGYFRPGRGCDDGSFVPNKQYLEWRKENPKPTN